MDVMPLNSQFKPTGDLIEGWSSLIWTERYRIPGEFELISPNIENIMALLPLGSCVAVDTSNEVMVVETYEIEKDPDETWSIKVGGRTLDSFLEGRLALNSNGPLKEQPTSSAKWKTSSLTASACARLMIQYHMVDGRLDPNDVVPNFAVTSSTTKTQTAKIRQIERGQLAERVLGVLAEENLGLRNVRPATSGTTNVTMQIYNGIDRTATVTLDVTAGHFDKTKYLFSIKGYKDLAHVYTQYSALEFANPNRFSIYQGSGMLVRDLLVDADDIDEPSGTDYPAMEARAMAAFKDNDLVRVFDGTVSLTVPFIYGVDYFLGDIIKVFAEYGIVQNMMVTEFIQAEDSNGIRKYPTLDFYVV